jgi:hypothetical protein
MPMKERLEPVPPIRADRLYPKRELLHDGVDKVDGIRLRVPAIDSEPSYSSGIIDGGVRVASHGRALLPL